MGSGHLGLRKIYEKETSYRDKFTEKHKHEYDRHCILEVVLANKRIQYYEVNKCNRCLSFKSIRKPYNIQGSILEDLTDEQKKLPIIKATYPGKKFIIDFADLQDVTFEELD